MLRWSPFAHISTWLNGRRKTGLSSSNITLQLLAENGSDVIFRFGPDGRARYISPSVERMYGYSPAEIYAMGCTSTDNPLTHPTTRR